MLGTPFMPGAIRLRTGGPFFLMKKAFICPKSGKVVYGILDEDPLEGLCLELGSGFPVGGAQGNWYAELSQKARYWYGAEAEERWEQFLQGHRGSKELRGPWTQP